MQDLLTSHHWIRE